MQIKYYRTTIPGTLRNWHVIEIDGERFESSRAKAVLIWAKPRIFDKETWNVLKECVRRGWRVDGMGGSMFGENNLHC